MSTQLESFLGLIDVEETRQYWRQWQYVLEDDGPPTKNRLLSDPSIFSTFALQHGVGRSIRAGTRDLLRQTLARSDYPIVALLTDCAGNELDRQERLLRPMFGTNGTAGTSLRAPLSKLAAMLPPRCLYPWDRHVHAILEISGTSTAPLSSYAAYSARMNLLFVQGIKDRIERLSQRHYPSAYAAKNDRFHKRVMYVYLLRLSRTKASRTSRRVALAEQSAQLS
jgi:hypothetical protein